MTAFRSVRPPRAALLAAGSLALAACASGGGAPPAATGPQRSVVTMSNASGGQSDIALFTDRGPTVAHFGVAPALVLQALPTVYGDVGLTGAGPVLGQAGTVGTNASVRRRLGKEPLSRFFECGRTPTGEFGADVHLLKVTVTSSVQPDGSGAAVRTNVVARAVPVDGSAQPMDCTSTGALETRIGEALKARIGG